MQMNPVQLQKALMHKMLCDVCNTSANFTVEKEEYIQGMIFIEGKCQICSRQNRIRIK